jgi:hypothetical protein
MLSLRHQNDVVKQPWWPVGRHIESFETRGFEGGCAAYRSFHFWGGWRLGMNPRLPDAGLVVAGKSRGPGLKAASIGGFVRGLKPPAPSVVRNLMEGMAIPPFAMMLGKDWGPGYPTLATKTKTWRGWGTRLSAGGLEAVGSLRCKRYGGGMCDPTLPRRSCGRMGHPGFVGDTVPPGKTTFAAIPGRVGERRGGRSRWGARGGRGGRGRW